MKLFSIISQAMAAVILIPIYIYRYSLSFFMGRHCRHEPSCSLYAIDAIKQNGAWKGGWLTLGRLWRCGPGGSYGIDPVPDLKKIDYPLWQSWRYGVWKKSKIMAQPHIPDKD